MPQTQRAAGPGLCSLRTLCPEGPGSRMRDSKSCCPWGDGGVRERLRFRFIPSWVILTLPGFSAQLLLLDKEIRRGRRAYAARGQRSEAHTQPGTDLPSLPRVGGDLAPSSQGASGSSHASPGLASLPGSLLTALWGAGLMSGVGEGCLGEQPGVTA